MKFSIKNIFSNNNEKAEEYLRCYLEKKYDLEIQKRMKAFCLCKNGRIFEFFYTLEEVREFLESDHEPFEFFFEEYGLKNDSNEELQKIDYEKELQELKEEVNEVLKEDDSSKTE